MRPLRRAGRPAWTALTAPAAATLLQTAVVWGWHLPAAMEAALHVDLIHGAMHASHLLAGVLFWSAVLRAPRTGGGAAAVAITVTMMQMGMPGALLTFAGQPRYPSHAERAPRIGLDALADQQLAGLIMWVPAALPYLVGGLALFAAWLRDAAPRPPAGRSARALQSGASPPDEPRRALDDR